MKKFNSYVVFIVVTMLIAASIYRVGWALFWFYIPFCLCYVFSDIIGRFFKKIIWAIEDDYWFKTIKRDFIELKNKFKM